GIMYSAARWSRQLEDRELKDEDQVKKASIRILENEFGGDGNGIMVLFQPVSRDGTKVGQLMARMPLSGMFDIDVFSALKDSGDIYLITGNGDIYLRETNLFLNEGEKHTNVYELLGGIAADGYSKKGIADMNRRSQMIDDKGESVNDYLSYTIVDRYGMTDYVESKSVSNIRDTYIMIVYPETVFTDVTKPLVFRTLMVSIILFLITIIMVTYMWYTSKTSSDLVERLAYEDPITGGKNDNYFREVASRAIWENSSIPYVVTRFDIANFRYINEAYGHVRADELLRIIDRECNKVFSGKEICVRMTADQFLLLSRNDQYFDAKFEGLLTEINEQAREIGIMFPIRLKRGVYPIRRDDNDIGIIIDHANAARKSLTGDEKLLVATYSEQIINQMFLNDKIESEMENAMKTEEFKVFIQAKWDIKDDHVHGGEALVRWIKHDGTRIFPDQFIPVFEKNGFVEKLDMYMLEQVCKYQRQLIDAGKRIYPISVNQSRLLMHNPDYLPKVERLIKRYRIPNGFVELEITETVFQDERALMIHTTNELKKMDIQLSMDDFGSGYSSLNMLKDVPFDVIKIDREFFSESITSEASVWILRKIIEMAEGLGIRTLCEGVENEEQVKLLRDLGCYYVQGYFYSKPIPFDEYQEKYCDTFEGGKEYYDNLYEEHAKAREERIRKEEEESMVSASSAVEAFKKNYKATENTPKKEEPKNEKDGRKMSSEEMKLAYLADAAAKKKKEEPGKEAEENPKADEDKAGGKKQKAGKDKGADKKPEKDRNEKEGNA
ncbi:MAG: GGDEF domain-containing protein, partial [Lachnospiraceae bacterium]|nr:GGDEF domain-containing protein [Lachnospiraceae bacterium]